MATAQVLANANIAASIMAKVSKSTDFQDAVVNFSKVLSYPLSAGTGSAGVDVLWADSRTLIADATEDLDLSGVLTDFYGDSVLFADIKAILIANTSTTVSQISWMAAASNGWAGAALPFAVHSQKRNIVKGCFDMIGNPLAGWAVAAGSLDAITITEESTLAAKYDIVIIGATA